jgi:hypothetical protein
MEKQESKNTEENEVVAHDEELEKTNFAIKWTNLALPQMGNHLLVWNVNKKVFKIIQYIVFCKETKLNQRLEEWAKLSLWAVDKSGHQISSPSESAKIRRKIYKDGECTEKDKILKRKHRRRCQFK